MNANQLSPGVNYAFLTGDAQPLRDPERRYHAVSLPPDDEPTTGDFSDGCGEAPAGTYEPDDDNEEQ